MWRCFNIGKQELQINEEIRDKELRIIGSNGEQLGIMSASQALSKAESMNLDLVKIAPQAKPQSVRLWTTENIALSRLSERKEARKKSTCC